VSALGRDQPSDCPTAGWATACTAGRPATPGRTATPPPLP